MSWVLNIAGLVASWYYTDLESESSVQNMLCPILVTVFLIIILVKFVLLLGPKSGRGGDDGGSFGGFGGDGNWGGGDGGGD